MMLIIRLYPTKGLNALWRSLEKHIDSLETRNYVALYASQLSGNNFISMIFELKNLEDIEEFYTNANWSGVLHVLDRDLKPVRDVHVGGVLRSAALDSRGRRGYTCDYISHMVTAFSLDTGEILGTRQLSGKGCRALQVLGSGDLIYSCGCGVLKIPPDAILISDEDRVDIRTKKSGRAFEARSKILEDSL